MAFDSYSSDRAWLDARLQTCLPDGDKFNGHTVKLYSGDKGSLSLEQFFTEQTATGSIIVTSKLASIDEGGGRESRAKQQRSYSVFVKTGSKVDCEPIIDAIRTELEAHRYFIVGEDRRFGRMKTAVNMRELSFDAYELTILIT